MTEEILSPPMLARGSWRSRTGVGCIMNLMCWVKGVDSEYGDHPPDMFDAFRQTLISFNDEMCVHLRFTEINTRSMITHEPINHVAFLNCPDCSQKLIDWAFALADSGWVIKTLSLGRVSGDNLNDRLQLERLVGELSDVFNELNNVTRNHPYFVDDIPPNIPDGDHFPEKWLPQYQSVMARTDDAFAALIECYQGLVEKYQPNQTRRQWLPLSEAVEKANFTQSVLSR